MLQEEKQKSLQILQAFFVKTYLFPTVLMFVFCYYLFDYEMFVFLNFDFLILSMTK